MSCNDKKSQSNKLEDQVFWWKADLNNNYKLCSSEIWKLQEMEDERRAMGINAEEDVEEDYNPHIIKKRSNAPQINVRKKFE
jgi:hypothetical protein